MQTPQRWASKLPVKVRSFAVEAKPAMVDRSTQYDITDIGDPQPVPETPVATKIPRPVPSDDLDQSFMSGSSIEIDEDQEDDPDYHPDFDMEVSDSEERLV